MWKPHARKNGLSRSLQHLDRFGGELPVRLVLVAALGGQPVQDRELAAGHVPAFALLAQSGRRKAPAVVPRFRILEGNPAFARFGVGPRVDHLAQADGGVAMLTEQLRQRDHVRHLFPKWSCVLENAGRVRPAAGQKRRSARIAHRVLTVGSIEADAPGGQAVDVRRLDGRRRVATQAAAKIIDDDEQDVGPLRRLDRQGERGHPSAQEAKEEQDERRGSHRFQFSPVMSVAMARHGSVASSGADSARSMRSRRP